jgi:hypothetical protein
MIEIIITSLFLSGYLTVVTKLIRAQFDPKVAKAAPVFIPSN